MHAKDEVNLATRIISDNTNLIDKINSALTDVNGRKYLPLWMEEFSNGRLENLSADALQGVKIALMYSSLRMRNFIEENVTYEVADSPTDYRIKEEEEDK